MRADLDAPDQQNGVGQRHRVFFSLLFNTGAQVSEIGLRIRDVIVEGSSASHLQGKGRKDETYRLWRRCQSNGVVWV
jgi:integrase/recombinase XerD